MRKEYATMTNFSFVLLYVDNPPASAAFYAELLGKQPIENSPTFAMLPLSDAVMLGLWIRRNVDPKAIAPAGGSEIAFTVGNADAVNAMHDDWKRRGIAIAQAPTGMDFGHTFTAQDPDGHRIRVFSRTAA
jgi:catechol 2,3-dioxygenase-like lactoylglutathione lyase family enzyme